MALVRNKRTRPSSLPAPMTAPQTIIPMGGGPTVPSAGTAIVRHTLYTVQYLNEAQARSSLIDQQAEMDIQRARLEEDEKKLKHEAQVLQMTERRATEFKDELREATGVARRTYTTEQAMLATVRSDLNNERTAARRAYTTEQEALSQMRDDAHAEWVDAEAKSDTANRKWQTLLNAEASADARYRQEVQELKDAMVANKIDYKRQIQAELTAERETNSLVSGREASELRAATASLTAEVNVGREKDRLLTAKLSEIRTHQRTNDATHERERTLRNELEARLAEVSAQIVSDSATLTNLNLELRSEQAACRDLLSECRDLDADKDWFREKRNAGVTIMKMQTLRKDTVPVHPLRWKEHPQSQWTHRYPWDPPGWRHRLRPDRHRQRHPYQILRRQPSQG